MLQRLTKIKYPVMIEKYLSKEFAGCVVDTSGGQISAHQAEEAWQGVLSAQHVFSVSQSFYGR